jgi:hypothetical protein
MHNCRGLDAEKLGELMENMAILDVVAEALKRKCRVYVEIGRYTVMCTADLRAGEPSWVLFGGWPSEDNYDSSHNDVQEVGEALIKRVAEDAQSELRDAVATAKSPAKKSLDADDDEAIPFL